MSVTLKEAINLLADIPPWPNENDDPCYLDALQLLVEAGKYVLNQYDPDHQMMRKLLPGERPEV